MQVEDNIAEVCSNDTTFLFCRHETNLEQFHISFLIWINSIHRNEKDGNVIEVFRK